MMRGPRTMQLSDERSPAAGTLGMAIAARDGLTLLKTDV